MSAKKPQKSARRLGVPFVAPLKFYGRIPDSNPVIAVCGGCGRGVHRMEGYSCPLSHCPIQPKAY